MPNRDDKSWLDALSGGPLNVLNYPGYAGQATQFAGNALSNIARSMSPVRFEDAEQSPVGQAGFVPQVPPMISETAGAWNRLFGKQDNWHDGPGEVYPGDQNADAATAALAFYGGNALNPLARVPRGGVASGAMREGASALDMSHQARLARAKEQGYDTDRVLYHGTGADIEAFDLARAGQNSLTDSGKFGVWLTDNPHFASEIADGQGFMNAFKPYHTAKKAWDSRSVMDRVLGRGGEEPVFDSTAASGHNVIPAYVNHGQHGFIDLSGSGEFSSRNLASEIKKFKDGGYDSVSIRTDEVGGNETVVFDPSNIRSVNAAFDPARAGENGLLFSDNKPSILGSALAGARDYGQAAYRNWKYPDEPTVINDPASLDVIDRFTKANTEVIGLRNKAGAMQHHVAQLENDAVFNDHGFGQPLDTYDTNALNQQWREKVKRTGELLSDNKPSILGGAAATADQPQGITAYHGSPHDFDKFSLDKIGTGEGAQAYGHGLYFAENEGVARSYRDAHKPSASFANDPSFLKWMEENGKSPEGRMYQVRINADPNDFLDWDKPLSQQPMSSAILKKFYPELTAEQLSAIQDAPGRHLYEGVGAKLGEPSAGDGTIGGLIAGLNRHDVATNALRDAGIPGIRYLDGNSRADGAGSSNYVVFDDSMIEILKKYGMAGAVLGAGQLGLGLTGSEANAYEYDPELEDILRRN